MSYYWRIREYAQIHRHGTTTTTTKNQHTESNQLRVIFNLNADVFHWSCLDERESGLPNNTAPGGHTCPTCYDQIIPPTNLISPVADVLRVRLKKTTWGRDEFVGTSILDHSINKPNNTAQQPSNSTVSQTSSYSTKQNLDNSSSAGSKPHAHEISKDHSINIDATAAYYQSKWLLEKKKLHYFGNR